MPSKPIVEQLEEPWYSVLKNAVCTDIETVSKDMFPTTNMEDTAIYYIDRTIPKDKAEEMYDRQLDVNDKIYDLIDENGHRLFIDGMSKMTPLKVKIPISKNDDDYKNVEKRTKEDKWYLNINRANGSFGAKWLTDGLDKENIKTREEELEFCKRHIGVKNIIECKTKEYGENLKRLMLKGNVLRYGLWLTQISQNIKVKQFKYVPDIDYTDIPDDFTLLKRCNFSDKDANIVLDYLKNFKFTRNRNDEMRKYVEKLKTIDSPSSGSEPSKSPSEMTLDELKVEFKKDYDEWSKSDEEEDFETWLKNKYPGMFIRKDED